MRRRARVQNPQGECLTNADLRDNLHQLEEAIAQKEAEKEVRKNQCEEKKKKGNAESW